MMYLYIYEDCSITKSAELSEGALEGVEAGILSVIDISNPDDPRDYYQGEWQPIESI